MSRFVWPQIFMLRAASLTINPTNQQAFNDARAKFFLKSNGTSAVSLRWSTLPNLGFPREPFQVYRRVRNSLELRALTTVTTTITTLSSSSQTIPLIGIGDLAYFVAISVNVASPNTVTVQALDINNQPIAGQSVTVTASSIVEFRSPGIYTVSVSGTGSVGPVHAIGETAYANLPDWIPIQTVGLPLLNNEIGGFYKTNPQGVWPTPTTQPNLTGVIAAENRLLIANAVQLDPPPTGIADFPLPAWPKPSAAAYMANMRRTTNLIPKIERCLENSVDTDPAKMQVLYTEIMTVDGVNQVGVPVSSPSLGQPSQVNLPVVGVAMLAATTDSYAATGLGYGTIDIPPLPSTPASSVSVAPATATLKANATQQFAAVQGSIKNPSVIWSVNGAPGGNATGGTITSAGLYTAPAAQPADAITVAATSTADPTQSGFASVTFPVIHPSTTVASVPAAEAVRPIESTTATSAVTSSGATTAPADAATNATPDATTFILVHPTVLPTADNYGPYDYMVTAPFSFTFGLTATAAALAGGQPPVMAPQGLASAVQQTHSPLGRDEQTPAAVKVSWTASPIPQGYGILVSRASNHSTVLNVPRPATVGGYDAFVALPPTPAPNTPPLQQNPGFSDLGSALPLGPPNLTDRYLVAAQDIFGAWSGWAETSAILAPPPVTKPGFFNAQFIYSANAGSPHSPVVAATLRIDFGWDWQDRSPGQIRFVGQFVTAPAKTLGPPFPTGFALSNGGSAGTPVIFTFHYGSPHVAADIDAGTVVPTIDSAHHANAPGVAILGSGSPPAPPVRPDIVQYRVEITGFELDFSAATELDYVIYASATEEVRPGVWSEYVDQADDAVSPPQQTYIGKIVKAFNPNPPVIVFTPPSMNWTALPDATGNARGVLTWTPDPNAAGYLVWEATESALLHKLPPGGTQPPPADTPYLTRAATLKTLIAQHEDLSLEAFARLTKDPIAATGTEIILPAAAGTLYAFRISAIGKNNVESARSPQVAVFGVPRRNVPGAPRLLLRTGSWSPPGIQVIVLPVESAAPPAGYRMFRVRSQELAMNPTAMGPAKIDENSSAWEPYTSTTLAGKTLSGMSALDTNAMPSWYPYYYRATVLGHDDPANGLYRGESPYSSIQEGYSLPAGAPLIKSLAVSFNPPKTLALVTLITDLPAAALSPSGRALVEVLELVQGSFQTLASSAAEQINQQSPPPTLPAVPPAHPVLRRSAVAGNEQWTLYISMPYSAAAAGNYAVRLTDPLKRQSSASF
jgi:hypothetical protein